MVCSGKPPGNQAYSVQSSARRPATVRPGRAAAPRCCRSTMLAAAWGISVAISVDLRRTRVWLPPDPSYPDGSGRLPAVFLAGPPRPRWLHISCPSDAVMIPRRCPYGNTENGRRQDPGAAGCPGRRASAGLARLRAFNNTGCTAEAADDAEQQRRYDAGLKALPVAFSAR